MEIRKLDKKENIKTRPLYEEVFAEDSKSFVDYYYTEKIKDNDIYVIEDQGKIISMIHLNPYEMVLFGNKLPIHYIVAVATKKEYRGQGLMKSLLIRVLNDLKKAGEVITYLMPVAEAIYAPYDFYTVNEKKWVYFKDLKAPKKDESYRLLKEEECQTLARRMNDKLAATYDLYIYRDEVYYQRLLKEYASENASLMAKIKAENLVDVIPDVVEPDMYQAKFMVRILDPEKFLSLIPVKEKLNAVITIKDNFIEDNNRWYHIAANKGERVLVKPVINNVISEVEKISILELTKKVFDECIPSNKIRFDEVV